MRINKPWWNTIVSIQGFEDPAPGGGEGTGSDEGGSGSDNGSGEENGGSGAGSGEGGGNEDTSGLKSALEKERQNNKALAKQLKAFEKAQQEKADAEKTEIQRLTEHSSKSTEKITKLASAFRQTKVESAIVAAAKNAKFLDPTDALRPEVISAIEVDQDEDDPSRVTVDTGSVEKAIKALADAKPHWLVDAAPSGGRKPSGSKFGGSGKTKQPTEEEALKAQYPALARRG